MQTANAMGHNAPPSDAEYLTQQLKEKHDNVLYRAQQLVEAAYRLPTEINDEETAGKASDYIKQVTGCHKNLEAVRVNEKEPFLSFSRIVDGFFKPIQDTLAVCKNKAQRPLDKYLIEKAAKERKAREEEAERLRKKAQEEANEAARVAAMNKPKEADAAMVQAASTETAAAKMEASAAARPAELARSRSESGALASLRTIWVGELQNREEIDYRVLSHYLSDESLQKAINAYVKAGGRVLSGAKIFEKSETVVR